MINDIESIVGQISTVLSNKYHTYILYTNKFDRYTFKCSFMHDIDMAIPFLIFTIKIREFESYNEIKSKIESIIKPMCEMH